MSNKQVNTQKIINHWVAGAEDDYKTMIAMINAKQFNWSLFLGHLIVEKLLKAYYVKIKEDYPPFVHNLLKLAADSNLILSEELKLELTTITAFNLNVRYDDYKKSFQKKCTPEYTYEWVNKIKKLKIWITEQIVQ